MEKPSKPEFHKIKPLFGANRETPVEAYELLAEWFGKENIIIDVVHYPEYIPDNCQTEDRIAQHLHYLNSLDFTVRKISGNLDTQLDDVGGKLVIVTGAIQDVCCEIRKVKLRAVGAIAVIDFNLSTTT